MLNPALWSKAPATAQLYHHDPYATTATAVVLAVEGHHAVFDRSLFYAESGGQVADQGTVDGQRVVDVQKAGGRPYQLPNGEVATIDSVFCHVFEEPCSLEVGAEVTMEIDWERRFRNMQMHTLAHFLFHATGEYLTAHGQARSTRGCHISDSAARFDFGCSIPSEAVQEIQARVLALLDAAGEAVVTPAGGRRRLRLAFGRDRDPLRRHPRAASEGDPGRHHRAPPHQGKGRHPPLCRAGSRCGLTTGSRPGTPRGS